MARRITADAPRGKGIGCGRRFLRVRDGGSIGYGRLIGVRDPEGETKKAIEAWEAAVCESDSVSGRATIVQRKENDVPATDDGIKGDVPERSARPPVAAGKRIQNYSDFQLREMVEWIMSDTLVRTDDDLLREMRKELGFKRGGKRIDAAIKAAIRDVQLEMGRLDGGRALAMRGSARSF